MSGKYCYKPLERSIEDEEMTYNPVSGSFMFYVKDEDWGGPGTFNQAVCCYCPYCRTKLPEDLRQSDDYYGELEATFGKELCDIKEEEIPEKFKSDEWWKKCNIVKYHDYDKDYMYEENIEIVNGERVLKV